MADLGASQFMSGELLSEYGREKVIGGGAFEAAIRIITQQNVTSEMEPGLRTTVAQMLDTVMGIPLWLAAAVLPEFGRFNFADFVAYGFDISPNRAVQCTLCAMAFLLPVFVAGYFFLKTREIAE